MSGIFSGFLCFASFFAITLAAAPSEAANVDAKRFTGWVAVEKNRSLYVDFEKPAPGKPVIALINGLTYRTGIWDAFVTGLRGEGYGILRWDPMGQGQTLLKYAPAMGPFRVEDQIKDMRTLFVRLGLKQPLHLVGLSYGGALASIYTDMYPEHVANCIAIAPFTAPLSKLDSIINTQVKFYRMTYPWSPLTDDQIYDNFLRTWVYSTYPAAEPIILENPYKLEATYRLVQGIRKYRFEDIAAKVPPGKFHLIVARRDEYIEQGVLEKVWEEVPPRSRQSRVYIEGSKHKIPEHVPMFSSALIKLIIAGHPAFTKGRTLVAVPSTGTVQNGREILIRNLPKE